MTSKSWISWFGVPVIAFALTVGVLVSTVHAVGDAHKVSVVSFGLFGDQSVFRSEATGAAQVVAGRFGGGLINVQYNSKKGGGATIETLDTSLQAAANGMDTENDVLFLILTSHGSRAGLAVKAGRLTQTLTPSNLASMLARTGMRHKVVVISACYSGIRDNGTGIPPEVKEKMFNPFFTTKPAGEGTGLGLSITHDIIVKQHSGSIEVDTQPGEFTEIRIVLPRTAALIAGPRGRT